MMCSNHEETTMSRVSRARQRTSQVNGAKSQGPVTEEGKARSSQNAVRHGVVSAEMVLSEQETGIADGIRYGYVRRYVPQDRLESEIVESLVLAMIKLRRLDRLELEAMERAVMTDDMNEPDGAVDQKRYPTLATLGRYRGRLNHERKLAEDRLMRLLRERPGAEGPMGLGAKQHRFMAEMIEQTGREQARLLAERGIEANDAGTHEGAGWDVIPVPPTPAIADTAQGDTNKPRPPAAAGLDALADELMAKFPGIADPSPEHLRKAIAAPAKAA